MRDLSREEARRLFTYRDGLLIWNPRPLTDFASPQSCASWHAQHCGRAAGTVLNSGYRQIGMTLMDGTTLRFLEHRVVWSWHYGPAAGEVDHRDRIRSNNRIENLRPATPRQQMANRSKRKNLSSIYVGVSFEVSRQRWKASIKMDGKSVTIGRFASEEEAARAYDERAYAEHGEFAVLNLARRYAA